MDIVVINFKEGNMKNFKRKRWVAAVSALVLVLVFMTACGGGNGDAGDGDTTDKGSGEPEFTLSFASYNPQESAISNAELEAIKLIEERSEGRVKIEGYWNGTLLEAMDVWSGTSDGLADISFYYITMSPGVQTVGEIFTQYYSYKAPDMAGTSKGFRQALDEIPELQAEAAAANMYMLDVLPPTSGVFMMTKEHKIKTPSDLKGLTLQGQGHFNDVLPDVGASGISLPPTDWYTSLEKGTVDALGMSWPGMRDFGMEDLVTDFVTFGDNGGLFCGGQTYLVNLDKWNSIPEDLQIIIRDAFREANDGLVEFDMGREGEIIQAAKDAGKSIQHIDEADMGPWYELAQKSTDLWIEDVNAKGYDGQAIWDKFVGIMTGV
jgi:TRAP-type C4-dicarboxylate transport system substrate-binding protein